MTMTPDEASTKVAAMREEFDIAREDAILKIEAAMRAGLDELVTKIVENQPDVLNALPAEKIATLKFNVNESINMAVAGVRGTVMSVDLDSVSTLVKKGASGFSLFKLGTQLGNSIRPVGLLFRDAGFNVAVSGSIGSFSGPDTFAPTNLTTSVDIRLSERALDRAAEAYGKAKIELREARFALQSREAKTAWDQA